MMECPECAKVTSLPPKMMEFEMASKCPRCGYKIRKATRTVSLSELDVARVLCAMRRIAPVNCYRYDDEGNRCITPEGWPMPSRLLMQQIAKLL